jgi:hypothetical protein
VSIYHPKDTNFYMRFWDGKSPWHGPKLAGPGWYVTAFENEGYSSILSHRKINPGQAEEIARTIDWILSGQPIPVRLDFMGQALTAHVKGLNDHLAVLLVDEERRLSDLIAQRAKVVKDLQELNAPPPNFS